MDKIDGFLDGGGVQGCAVGLDPEHGGFVIFRIGGSANEHRQKHDDHEVLNHSLLGLMHYLSVSAFEYKFSLSALQ
jgi:hypothetical protein